MALENGEIDMIFGAGMVDAETYNRFKDKEGFGANMSEPVSTRMLLLNTTDAIVGDLNVRKALQHAIDKEAISKAIFEGIESPADFLFATTVPYANVGLTAYELNLSKAETLLEESGWKKVEGKKFREKNGKELAITFNYNTNNPIDKTISEFIQGEVSKIGINLNLVGEEEQANRDRMKAGNFQMIFNISWGNPYDPHSFLAGTTAAGVYGDYYAQLGIKDKKEIDKAIIEALESTDENKRQELYKFVLTRLHEEGVYLPLTNERNRVVFNNKVENATFDISKYEIPVYKMNIK